MKIATILSIVLIIGLISLDVSQAADRYSSGEVFYRGSAHNVVAESGSREDIYTAALKYVTKITRIHKVQGSERLWTVHGLHKENPVIVNILAES